MSAITFTSLTYTGTPNADDVLAAQKLVREENVRRAALDPPGTPLSNVGAALKASVLVILTQNLSNWWDSYAQQARQDRSRFSLNTRLDNGESKSQILTDIAS